MLPIYVLTNDNNLFLLRGFAYLWNEYTDQPVTVVGYSPPEFKLPDNFTFHSLGSQKPASKWSDGLIEFVEQQGHQHFILLLEDYWLYDRVDRLAINRLTDLITDNVLRIDLSGNRAAQKQAKPIGEGIMGYEIVQTPPGTRYQMSFQAAIWHRENMLKVLQRDESPWQAEILGSKRVSPEMQVLGTRPAVMRYQPVYRSRPGKWQLDKIPADKLDYIKKQMGLA